MECERVYSELVETVIHEALLMNILKIQNLQEIQI